MRTTTDAIDFSSSVTHVRELGLDVVTSHKTSLVYVRWRPRETRQIEIFFSDALLEVLSDLGWPYMR